MRNKLPVLAIDARLYGNRSGAGRIATATVDRLTTDHADSFERIVLVAHSKKVYDSLPADRNVQRVFIPGHFLFGKLLLLPFVLRTYGVDAYFSPTSELPLWKFGKTKYLNMVHDLFMEEILDASNGPKRSFRVALAHFVKTRNALESFYLSGMFSSWFRIADGTVAISRFSMDQAVSRYGLDSGKFAVIPIAADDRFFEDYSVDELLRSRLERDFGIRGKYVFTYDVFIDYSRFAPVFANKCSSSGCSWVVLSRYPEIRRYFEANPEIEGVKLISEFVSDEALADLIRASEFVFFPSEREGFGLPLAESLACQKPVLAPSATALPEVGRGLATIYDPDDPEDLSAKCDEMFRSYESFPDPRNAAPVSEYRWSKFSASLSRLLQSLTGNTDHGPH